MVKLKDGTNPSLRTDEITTILGKGSEFEGKLQFEGTLRIEGVFSGEIHSDSVLVVGEGAKVSAEVDVGTIVINGEVRGNVRAKTGVEIRHPGRLIGNVEAPSLIIEQGVIFEGSCKMENFSTRKDSFLAPAEKEKKTADNGEKAKSI
jgi:cytoskeletal protein CcmA (bactofilin family)